MKHWTEQAEKNNLVIKENGKCQLCGSNTKDGLRECVEKAAFITHLHEHEKGVEEMTIFLCTDAHALSHGEIHGRWNNHFHMTRLYLILVKGIQWHYKLSPKLSQVVNDYKDEHMSETIPNPPYMERGQTTVTDVESAQSASYNEAVRKWAHDVFMAFEDHHHIASLIADRFIAGYNF